MADIQVFQVPAILDGVTPRKDGGVSLRFVTNEVTKAEKVTLMEFYQSFGWLQFSDQQIHAVPKESPTREAGVRTPSQRLRAALFVLWQERYSDEPFDPWYEKQMAKVIERIKKELPER